jgi:hypothetical protein
MTDREPDLDALLRSDARAWRDQVDAARPDLVTTPTRRRTVGPYVAGLVAAALSEDPDAPVSAPAIRAGQVPAVAYCPTDGTGGAASGFAVSFAEGFAGAPTIEAAAAKFPPKNVQWTLAAQNGRAALLTYASHYLHLIRLSGGGWAVDSGGDCGGATATITR